MSGSRRTVRWAVGSEAQRARAATAAKPYCIARNIFFSPQLNNIFKWLKVLKNSGNIVHTSEVTKIWVWYGSSEMARQFPLQSSPVALFTQIYKMYFCGSCITPRLKRASWSHTLITTGSWPFCEFIGNFFAIYRFHIFNKLFLEN